MHSKNYVARLLSFCLWATQLDGSVYAKPIVGGHFVQTVYDNSPPYPYIVSLQDVVKRNSSVDYRHFCGGSVIKNNWILTAAHCIWRKNLADIVAVIGHENISDVHTLEHHTVDHVEYIYFQPANYQNDIALIRLRKPLDDSITLIRLPKNGMKANKRKSCKIVGYGATHYAGDMQSNLIEGEVRIISNKKCSEILGHIWAPQTGENTICALGANQDTCQGDSGGPLICDYDGENFVFGIVSHGLTCGITGAPSVYTVTQPYYEWIQLVINN